MNPQVILAAVLHGGVAIMCCVVISRSLATCLRGWQAARAVQAVGLTVMCLGVILCNVAFFTYLKYQFQMRYAPKHWQAVFSYGPPILWLVGLFMWGTSGER